MSNRKHPRQPLFEDKQGIIRFERNEIVRFLLETSKITENDLEKMSFSQEDREQFAQLIGYSLEGFGYLRYVSQETLDEIHGRNKKPEISKEGVNITKIKKILKEIKDPLALLNGLINSLQEEFKDKVI